MVEGDGEDDAEEEEDSALSRVPTDAHRLNATGIVGSDGATVNATAAAGKDCRCRKVMPSAVAVIPSVAAAPPAGNGTSAASAWKIAPGSSLPVFARGGVGRMLLGLWMLMTRVTAMQN